MTPRPLLSDAYTVSGSILQDQDSLDWSVYYGTFRKFPEELRRWTISPTDQRILFSGLTDIVNRYLLPPITEEEIDQTKKFLKDRKYMANGLANYESNERGWQFIVHELGGKLPLHIEAMPEGSTVYPNEPVFRVKNTVKGFGWLAAHFEPILMKCWATSARLTYARHWLEYVTNLIMDIENISYDEALKLARLQVHDFGCRASMSVEEDETVAMQHLYCFSGTDTFPAAYHAWKRGAPSYEGGSVWALAHRIVQGYVREGDCYENMYNKAQNHSILSMVADCYDYKFAVQNYLVPLAKRSVSENNGKIVVCRPDSGDPIEMVTWTVKTAIENGLFTKDKDGFYRGTTLRFIEGDGMDFKTINEIYDELIKMQCLPWHWGLFGIGGFLRNSITRDCLSTKYALCSVGESHRPVIKFSNTPGKETLPNVIVSRYKDNLQSGETVRYSRETRFLDAMQNIFWNGYEGANDNFKVVQNRVLKTFSEMPNSAGKYSKEVKNQIESLRKEYVRTI